MKKEYTSGIYKVILDTGDKEFTFETLQLTKRDAKELITSMSMFGHRIRKIDFIDYIK